MAKIELITPAQEKNMLSAMKSAVSLHNEGYSPTEAVIKSAKSHNLGPEFASRLVEAFNASKTVSHFRKTAGEDRAATFPLANGAEVIKGLYTADEPEKAAATVHSLKSHNFFSTQPKSIKAASTNVPTVKGAGLRATRVAKLYGMHNHLEKLGSDIRVAMLEAQDKAEKSFVKAADLLRSHGNSFDQIEYRVVGTYGDAGARVMNKLWSMADFERLGQKRASEKATRPVVMDNSAVYNTIRDLMSNLDKAAAAYAEYEHYKQAVAQVKKYKKSEETFNDTPVDPVKITKTTNDSDDDTPDGITPGDALRGIKSMKDLIARPTTQAAPVTSVTPMHEASLRAIKTKLMLNDFMVNDPVLSGYAPADVITAYNQIADMVPGIASEPMVMRGLIARVLQTGGRVDPHEARSLYDTESAQRNVRTRGY